MSNNHDNDLAIVPHCKRIDIDTIGSSFFLEALVDFLNTPLNDDKNHFYSVQTTVDEGLVIEATLTSSVNTIKFEINDNDILCSISHGVNVEAGKEFESTQIVVASINESTHGNRIHIAEYPDAILIGINNKTNSAWIDACHAGRIYCSNHLSDPDRGSDGHGILGGNPKIVTINDTSSWMALGTNTSIFRIGNTNDNNIDWKSAIPMYDLNVSHAGFLGGFERLSPIQIRASQYDGNDYQPGVCFGVTKYIKEYKSNQPHRAMIPSEELDSDQAWLIFNSSHNEYVNNVILWNKCVAA
jgi:hypothetical protein